MFKHQPNKVQYTKSEWQDDFSSKLMVAWRKHILWASLTCRSEYQGTHFNRLTPPNPPRHLRHPNLGHPSCLLPM